MTCPKTALSGEMSRRYGRRTPRNSVVSTLSSSRNGLSWTRPLMKLHPAIQEGGSHAGRTNQASFHEPLHPIHATITHPS
eukprot:15525_4